MDYMATKMDDQITGAISENERLSNENSTLREMAVWSYTKLHNRHFNDLNDALMLDRLKLYLEHGIVA